MIKHAQIIAILKQKYNYQIEFPQDGLNNIVD